MSNLLISNISIKSLSDIEDGFNNHLIFRCSEEQFKLFNLDDIKILESKYSYMHCGHVISSKIKRFVYDFVPRDLAIEYLSLKM